MIELSKEQRKRYARQLVLPGVDEAGQLKLAATHALIVGCGGLGSPVAAYLAGAGVGTLTLVDGDRPVTSNLHRQVLYHDGESRPKAVALAEHCSSLNPGTSVLAQTHYLGTANVKALVEAADIVFDCTDDAATKHLLNDACHLLRTPLVYAAAQVYEGYVALFTNQNGDAVHLRDLFPEPDPTLPNCATTGALGTAVGIIGMLQANAALCYLLGIGSPPVGKLLTYNALTNEQHRVTIRKTYTKTMTPPWRTLATTREALEAQTFEPEAYDGVFSMLDEQREPELVTEAVRVTKRNPYGQCVEHMKTDGKYLLYCNSGKLSLMLASQLRKAGYEVYSLAGGLVKYGL